MKYKRSIRYAGWLLSLAIFVPGLWILLGCHPPKYVYRVYRHRGADYADVHRFAASQIAGSPSPVDLPSAPTPRVAEVLESHPRVDGLERTLEETETVALLVVHRGRLVLEEYRGEASRESLLNTFSISKSLASALVGLAVGDGLVELEAPITDYLPELAARDERFGEIRVSHLLRMRSGIRYSRKVSFPFVNSDDPLIYFHPDLESVVLGRTEIAAPPGEFQYNNYNPPLLGLILRRTAGVAVSAYLERRLWQPMGAEAAAGWTVDDRGLERMESGFHARGRDLARFGLLYLRSGAFGEARILPTGWVEWSTQLAEPVEIETFNGRSWVYGAGWWILPRPEGPADFCAIGADGQFLYVSPRFDAVFVRSGPGRGDWSDFDWTELFYFAAERL